MTVAHQYGACLLNDHALLALENTEFLQGRTKVRSRFTTLPFEVANRLFAKAIEFYLEYGDELVDYYLALAKDGRDIRMLSVPMSKTPSKLDISTWRHPANKREEFFSQLRSGNSLYNMFEALYGAIVILVNTLMARRLSELLDLTPQSVVEDSGGHFLAFNLCKANVGKHRERVLRPLPTIGADALKTLGRLSRTLSELGYVTHPKLFQIPINSWHDNHPFFGTRTLDRSDLYRCLDRFCDYYQSPTDDKGRRYYVRPHQLRRNFAMIFFWQASFGGIDLLRYFLGHKNPSMTYHYVSEAIKGKTLRRVKATVAKELIKVDHTATGNLAQLICLTLNDLHILPERDVVDYIEDLMVSGEASIEPEFINGPNGEEYRVIYKIIDKSSLRPEICLI